MDWHRLREQLLALEHQRAQRLKRRALERVGESQSAIKGKNTGADHDINIKNELDEHAATDTTVVDLQQDVLDTHCEKFGFGSSVPNGKTLGDIADDTDEEGDADSDGEGDDDDGAESSDDEEAKLVRAAGWSAWHIWGEHKDGDRSGLSGQGSGGNNDNLGDNKRGNAEGLMSASVARKKLQAQQESAEAARWHGADPYFAFLGHVCRDLTALDNYGCWPTADLLLQVLERASWVAVDAEGKLGSSAKSKTAVAATTNLDDGVLFQKLPGPAPATTTNETAGSQPFDCGEKAADGETEEGDTEVPVPFSPQAVQWQVETDIFEGKSDASNLETQLEARVQKQQMHFLIHRPRKRGLSSLTKRISTFGAKVSKAPRIAIEFARS